MSLSTEVDDRSSLHTVHSAVVSTGVVSDHTACGVGKQAEQVDHGLDSMGGRSKISAYTGQLACASMTSSISLLAALRLTNVS